MNKLVIFILIGFIFFSCSNETHNSSNETTDNSVFISAVDISSYPEISETNPVFLQPRRSPRKFPQYLKRAWHQYD